MTIGLLFWILMLLWLLYGVYWNGPGAGVIAYGWVWNALLLWVLLALLGWHAFGPMIRG